MLEPGNCDLRPLKVGAECQARTSRHPPDHDHEIDGGGNRLEAEMGDATESQNESEIEIEIDDEIGVDRDAEIDTVGFCGIGRRMLGQVNGTCIESRKSGLDNVHLSLENDTVLLNDLSNAPFLSSDTVLCPETDTDLLSGPVVVVPLNALDTVVHARIPESGV